MEEFDNFVFNSDGKGSNVENTAITSEESSVSEEGTSYEDEDDHGLDEDQDFELSSEVGGIISLIALNQSYLDLIERLIKKTEHLIDNNRDEQNKIKQFLSSRRSGNRVQVPIYRIGFMPPYFKDIFNMIPPSNEDSRAIRRECRVNVLIKEEKPWTHEELKLLKKAVTVQTLEFKNKDVTARRDHLREQILNFRAEDKIDQLTKWKKELVSVNRRLKYLTSRDDQSTLNSSSYDGIDWARISFKDFKGNRTISQIKAKWLFEQAPHWNTSAWTAAEDEALICSCQTQWQNWDFVATRLDTRRTPYMCFERFIYLQKRSSAKRPWTAGEDEMLVSLVNRFEVDNRIDWRKVAAHMPGRNRAQCETRYTRSLSPTVVHGRWTDEEDMLLIASVNKYGPHDWPRIAQLIPGRTDVQCRARWIDNLDYKRSKAPWSGDEDETILMGVMVFGRSNFSSIAKLIPGRNTSAVKCRIRTLFRWKISIQKELELGNPPKTLGQVMESSRLRAEGAFKRFNMLMEMSKKSANNPHGYALAQRLGYGNYVVNDKVDKTDYSLVKQELTNKFGKWFISSNGRWVRLGKNPNEFGEKELLSVMKNLSADKKAILEKFFAERNARQQAVKNNRSANNSIIRDTKQSERIARLMESVLVITQKDLDVYNKVHKSSRYHPARAAFKKFTQKKPSAATIKSRNQKMSATFSTLIHDLAPQRYTIADRVTDEITHRVNKISAEDRRSFILTIMCDTLAQQMEFETQKQISSILRPILNVKILNYLHGALANVKEPDDEAVDPSAFLEDSDYVLHRLLKSLVPPSGTVCNMMLAFRNMMRPLLIGPAKMLFPVTDTSFRQGASYDTCFVDIQLSEEVTSAVSYKLLKERMINLFLIPMLIKRAFEAESLRQKRILLRQRHIEFKALQQAKLDEAGVRVEGKKIICPGLSQAQSNEQIITALNQVLPFRIFNPEHKKKIKYENVANAGPVRAKRRRIEANVTNRSVETTLRGFVSAGLKGYYGSMN